jgi:hypothetical protein
VKLNRNEALGSDGTRADTRKPSQTQFCHFQCRLSSNAFGQSLRDCRLRAKHRNSSSGPFGKQPFYTIAFGLESGQAIVVRSKDVVRGEHLEVGPRHGGD